MRFLETNFLNINLLIDGESLSFFLQVLRNAPPRGFSQCYLFFLVNIFMRVISLELCIFFKWPKIFKLMFVCLGGAIDNI